MTSLPLTSAVSAGKRVSPSMRKTSKGHSRGSARAWERCHDLRNPETVAVRPCATLCATPLEPLQLPLARARRQSESNSKRPYFCGKNGWRGVFYRPGRTASGFPMANTDTVSRDPKLDTTRPHDETPELRAKIDGLEAMLAREREALEEVRADRDAWKQQATALLAAPQKDGGGGYGRDHNPLRTSAWSPLPPVRKQPSGGLLSSSGRPALPAPFPLATAARHPKGVAARETVQCFLRQPRSQH